MSLKKAAKNFYTKKETLSGFFLYAMVIDFAYGVDVIFTLTAFHVSTAV